LIISHIAGEKNSAADWLSRIYVVDSDTELTLSKGFNCKSAQHVVSPFVIGTVLSKEDIFKVFKKKW
jgi:hypothetical protein